MKELNEAKTMAEMRELDRIAIEERGIPSLDLMEHAAEAVCEASLPYIGAEGSVVVFCGFGNNGGDGYAAARMLSNQGVKVTLYTVGNSAHITKDAEVNLRKLSSCDVTVRAFHDYYGTAQEGILREELSQTAVIIDAIFGVGISREVGGEYRDAITVINTSGRPVVSCDIPSGLNGDSGEVMGVSVKADCTVTFSCAKKGLYLGDGPERSGKVVIADIGIPKEIIS